MLRVSYLWQGDDKKFIILIGTTTEIVSNKCNIMLI